MPMEYGKGNTKSVNGVGRILYTAACTEIVFGGET
jgi:hypothetical protein